MAQNIGVCILLLKHNQVLLGKRKNAYKAGFYGLPGGRVEVHEKLEECARRELREETGVEVGALQFLGFVKEAQDGYDFIHFVFVCKDFAGEPQCMEKEKCEGWEWFDIDTIPEMTLVGHVGAVELFLKKNVFVEITEMTRSMLG